MKGERYGKDEYNWARHKPINRMIDSSVSCSKCGTKGMFNCDCFYRCPCGWIIEKDKDCHNPKCGDRLKKKDKDPILFMQEQGFLL